MCETPNDLGSIPNHVIDHVDRSTQLQRRDESELRRTRQGCHLIIYFGQMIDVRLASID